MSDFVTSLIRTWTPMVVGSVIAWLTARGIALDDGAVAGLTAFMAALFSALYYFVARLIERQNPKAGVLLGTAKKVEYSEIKK